MPLDFSNDPRRNLNWRIFGDATTGHVSPYYWVVNENGERERFKVRDAQREFLGNAHGRDLILKARQLGFTTFSCLLYLDACLHVSDTRAALIAHKLDDAQRIFRDKVRFPYENLPGDIKARLPLARDSATELLLANNSSFQVSTSARSGTVQYLHISEFGKICATQPEKAREIVTGSFPAVPASGRIVIESTAEGQEGHFFRMTELARELERNGREPHDQEFRFHFFPWWRDGRYEADPSRVPISDTDARYFERLEAEIGRTLTDAQKAWWVLTEAKLGGDMFREYPATPDEAFQAAIEGAYFSAQMASSDKHGRIGDYPVDPRYPVNTAWDLGFNDFTAIWLHQRIGQRNRLVGYYENSGESIMHYASWLKEWFGDHDCAHGETYWPHDGSRGDLFYTENKTRLDIASEHGLRPSVVPRAARKIDDIDAARAFLPSCDFDERGCATGIKHLRQYRKAWDDQRGVWKDRPHHDNASHGADAFMVLATGFKPPSRGRLPRINRPSARV